MVGNSPLTEEARHFAVLAAPGAGNRNAEGRLERGWLVSCLQLENDGGSAGARENLVIDENASSSSP